MPVPFEAIIPLGIIMGMFGVTGTLINLSRRYQHDWKPERFQLDRWDKLMMERDRRLTGSLYGQTSNPTAPPSFSTNSVWYLSTGGNDVEVHRTTKTTPNLLKEQLIQTFYPEHQTHELLLSHSLQQQVSESNEDLDALIIRGSGGDTNVKKIRIVSICGKWYLPDYLFVAVEKNELVFKIVACSSYQNLVVGLRNAMDNNVGGDVVNNKG
nr:6844_t:CDS:2 [Entrophospora candida]